MDYCSTEIWSKYPQPSILNSCMYNIILNTRFYNIDRKTGVFFFCSVISGNTKLFLHWPIANYIYLFI